MKSLPSLILSLLSLLAYVLAGAAYANAAPTTQPGSNDARYLQGWVDAGGIIARPTPTPLTIQQIFAGAHPNSVNKLPAGTFVIPVGVLRNVAPGSSYLGGGQTTIKWQTVAGQSTGIDDHFGCTIDGVLFDSDKPIATAGPAKVGVNCVRTYAHTVLSNCIASNIDDLIFFESTASGSVTHCAAGDKSIRGDFIFIGGATDITIDSCPGKDSPFTGSWNEHWIRIDGQPEPPNGNTAARITIQNCALRNFNGKESETTRTANASPASTTKPAVNPLKPEDGVWLDNCDFYAWTRAGQVAPAGAAPPLMSVRLFTLTNCRFHEKAYVQIDQGVTASVDATFDNYAGFCPIHSQGPHVNLLATVKLIDMPNQPGINHDMIMMNGMVPGVDEITVNGVNMNPKK